MDSLPAILAIDTANPTQRYNQQEIYELAYRSSDFYRSKRVQQIFMNSDIEFRHLYFDIGSFQPDETSDELHGRYHKGALEVGGKAIEDCLNNGRIDVSEIDFIIAVSCTGYLCPGLSSLYIKELDMRKNIQRADLLGMGCAGAMPGLQRAYDFVKAYPQKKALLITVEICSACYYVDESLETVVGNAICADGAAAVVVGMKNEDSVPQRVVEDSTRRELSTKIVGFESRLDPSYIGTVGFEFREGKLRVVLSKDLRDVAGKLGKTLIESLLKTYHVRKEDIRHWILHSGGRKVIDGLQKELGLSDEQVANSKCVLKNFGNMSSPTVLFVLKETLRHNKPQRGDLGVMLAMGPGLAIEGALLKW